MEHNDAPGRQPGPGAEHWQNAVGTIWFLHGFRYAQLRGGVRGVPERVWPCQDARENPICTPMPGYGSRTPSPVVDTRGQTWIAYHAWEPNHVGDSPGAPGRLLWLDPVDWKTVNRSSMARPAVPSRPEHWTVSPLLRLRDDAPGGHCCLENRGTTSEPAKHEPPVHHSLRKSEALSGQDAATCTSELMCAFTIEGSTGSYRASSAVLA